MDIKSKNDLHREFNNQTCIFLARVIEHLSICRHSIPSLRRNGTPFFELIVPQLALPTPLYISYPHMYYQHNLYHLTRVAYQTCSADETFPKCPMEFHSKPISKIGENLPMKFGSCGHHTWSSCNMYPWHIHQVSKHSIIIY